MQRLTQDICMINMIVSTIFSSKEVKRQYEYDWTLIENHSGIFSTDYSYEDAQIALQLSLMVTNANFETPTNKLTIPSNISSWLIDIPIMYDMCPLEMIAKAIPNSKLNEPTPLCRILYNQRDNIIFIVFTGTSNGCMASLDLDYLQTDLTSLNNYIPGLRGHKGVYQAYQSVRQRIINTLKSFNSPQIVITGHSLGGSLSTLCALDLSSLNPIHYSFAAPLLFNSIGCDVFNKVVPHSYRIVNLSDMVTLFPLPIMPSGDIYCHVGTLAPFQRNLQEYHRNHSLAYMLEFNLPFKEIVIKD